MSPHASFHFIVTAVSSNFSRRNASSIFSSLSPGNIQLTHIWERKHTFEGEAGGQRAKRKKKASDNLDEALKEILPTSDPISHFRVGQGPRATIEQ